MPGIAQEAATASARSASGASARPKGDPPAGRVVAGDDPEVRVGAPAARDDAADGLLERLRGEDAARDPAGEHGGGRVAPGVGERAKREPPGAGADRRQGALELEAGATGAVGLGGRAPVGVDDALEYLAARMGDHEPGRDAGGAERADHRAGRGADDVVGLGGVPAGLGGQRVEPAGQPGAALDPARAEDEPHLHGPTDSRGGRRRGACDTSAAYKSVTQYSAPRAHSFPLQIAGMHAAARTPRREHLALLDRASYECEISAASVSRDRRYAIWRRPSFSAERRHYEHLPALLARPGPLRFTPEDNAAPTSAVVRTVRHAGMIMSGVFGGHLRCFVPDSTVQAGNTSSISSSGELAARGSSRSSIRLHSWLHSVRWLLSSSTAQTFTGQPIGT